MVYFQIKRIQNTMKMVCGVLWAVIVLTGCVAQKTENVQPAKQDSKEAVETVEAVAQDRLIESLNVVETGGNINITVSGNGPLEYTAIRQSFPFGIAVYFQETKISEDFEKGRIVGESISGIDVGYADEAERMAKVEILLKEDVTYDVKKGENYILVSLTGTAASQEVSRQVAAVEEDTDDETVPAPQPPEEKLVSQPVVVPDTTATMTNIEFTTLEGGKSDIVVQTNQPVRYDVRLQGDDKINLILYNTIIPDHHKRPILTHYFKSAVESLMPKSIPGGDKNSVVVISTRQKVPYRVVQIENEISMFFEPSTVEPPAFDKAKKKVVSGETVEEKVTMSGLGTLQPKPDLKTDEEKKKTLQEEILGVKKEYTGEKIKLDFYETDIKNVFRILRSVGGKNFAIDKDVKGSVTLTLEDPVPWDQVLDLVLKMNNLGMKQEGNVVRIATLDRLQKEEKLIQDTIKARQKSLEQQKSLEPMVTEYIPINYSDANNDIKPHVEKILTPKRGTVSVNSRTNMVIITDTQDKIDQAKELIFRLDKVTPQIMIEAKVVEVTKDFSQSLGLGLSFNKPQTAHTGRDRDFSVALNHPLSAASHAVSFNFFRLLGSDFLNLKAELSASETKGDVKVISSPRILTLDNKKAMIKQGLEYAYLERDSSGGSSVKFKNIDLLLEVTPHVTPDRRIAMTVFLTKNDIDTVTDGIPSLSTNETQTELLVNNNDTIVIGGIVKTTDNDSSSGTPVLSGIPVLGRLFRTDIKKDKRNELLIFLTPAIVQLEQKRNTYAE